MQNISDKKNLVSLFSTRLQHTDVDVPHYSQDNHNFVKGALHTIDRPYDKLDPWGFIDFLHHKIGTTHVAHHFDSTIPHYKASGLTSHYGMREQDLKNCEVLHQNDLPA